MRTQKRRTRTKKENENSEKENENSKEHLECDVKRGLKDPGKGPRKKSDGLMLRWLGIISVLGLLPSVLVSLLSCSHTLWRGRRHRHAARR